MSRRINDCISVWAFKVIAWMYWSYTALNVAFLILVMIEGARQPQF